MKTFKQYLGEADYQWRGQGRGDHHEGLKGYTTRELLDHLAYRNAHKIISYFKGDKKMARDAHKEDLQSGNGSHHAEEMGNKIATRTQTHLNYMAKE